MSTFSSPRAALVFEGEVLSYEMLEERVRAAAAGMAARGVKATDRVALVAGNHPDVVALFLACLRMGVALAPLNARLAAPELEAQVARIRPALFLADAEARRRCHRAELLRDVFWAGTAPEGPAAELAPDAPALLVFTSGTTGAPKAAILTRTNLEAAATASAERIGGSDSDRWLGTLPLFHVGGLVMVYRSIWAKACLVLERRFEASRVWELLRGGAITHASFVATTLQRLLDASPDNRAPASLKATLVGGGPVPVSLLERARARGFPALHSYGLTEACAQVCTEIPALADGSSAGPPLAGLEVRTVGVLGEIEVRGPTVMQGYFEAPEASRAVLRDGWLRTGDVGSIDLQGRLKVDARRTDLILRGGENVYPAEVEAILLGHPSVADAAVVGIESQEWGQEPVAFVAFRTQGPEAGALERWCRERLGAFKVPRRFVAVAAVPRNAVGKVDRVALQALAGPIARELRSQS